MSTFDALRAIGWPLPADAPAPDGASQADSQWHALIAQHPQARPARVIEQHRSGYVVADGPDSGFPVESLPEWQRPPGYRKGTVTIDQRPGVGDWLLIEGRKAVALLPRRSAIKRGAAGEHYQQQLIAANVDTVFVVCGLDADFNPRRIERYLLLVRGGGVEPVVVLTKADQATATDAEALPEAMAALVELAAQGVAVRAVNAKDPDSVAALGEWLGPGRTAVLIGSSGAGKSTLTNTLLGIEKMKTSAVRQSDSRGRHTTTHRALIPLPTGACLIDTPGMRELKPTGEEDVAENFSDVEALAEQCRFRDCKHAKEPGCAVRAAIEAGKLDPQRFANYLKLSDEVAGAANKLANRRAQKAEEKVVGKALNKRLDEKYGRH
ncbi:MULTISPECIES: ribosome small subunit-dependent GTPase A [unclassified Lysobacter]|uniref:ribosome small subunit-dependent GTPase A n=1 Tax=unclassified Lysobacter TaxID=2635362 RepID=UPI001C249026|nr:ribosome small subunit-dependent GTPase A [Lysobacter sp. MMG2]MBU8977487.1 ribosome small subunit-dependent GTPase A [Lysobacter sp. MMG2]